MVDSIHYAKRIQTALLPRMGDFRTIFPQSFIFCKPKDIVSGDFFWCYETPTRKYIIMADCTGHGVPGALMSIIGNELLNRIIMEQKVTDPARILYMLEDGITGSLKNSGSVHDVKDGMDIAVCVLEEGKRLHFAGASLSLFLQRKGHNDLTELKGSLFPIGNELDYTDKTFDTQTITIEKGDVIYLSSDGYYSQFGGPNNKKFMRSSFKSMLAGLGGLDMQKRKNIAHIEFERWKGATTQIDDVTVIGIEI
jgi:serine phosphatase RsbU (regulator of sigma subunit)